MAYKTVSVDVDVDIDLEDFDDDDIIDIIESRGYTVIDANLHSDTVLETIQEMYQRRRTGQDYQDLLNELFYKVLGKIV